MKKFDEYLLHESFFDYFKKGLINLGISLGIGTSVLEPSYAQEPKPKVKAIESTSRYNFLGDEVEFWVTVQKQNTDYATYMNAIKELTKQAGNINLVKDVEKHSNFNPRISVLPIGYGDDQGVALPPLTGKFKPKRTFWKDNNDGTVTINANLHLAYYYSDPAIKQEPSKSGIVKGTVINRPQPIKTRRLSSEEIKNIANLPK